MQLCTLLLLCKSLLSYYIETTVLTGLVLAGIELHVITK